MNYRTTPTQSFLHSPIITSLEGLLLPPQEVYKGYLVLDPRFLYPDQVIPFPLYVYHYGRNRFVLFKQAGDSISKEQLMELSHQGRHAVFIQHCHSEPFTRFLSEDLSQIVGDEALPVEEKTNRFHTIAVSVMQSIFETPPVMEELLKTARNVSNALSDLILHEPTSMAFLNAIRGYDYTTYTHSLNVCALGIGLYRHLETQVPPIKIRELTRGLLLHDIGKCDIPLELIQKPGELSDEEWRIMRSHPLRGYIRLEKDAHLSDEAHQLVLFHHESVDGSGYPNGLTKDMIPLSSRICKVVDVYDALTSNRCYKARIPPFESLHLMMHKMKFQIDQEILKEFVIFLQSMSKMKGTSRSVS